MLNNIKANFFFCAPLSQLRAMTSSKIYHYNLNSIFRIVENYAPVGSPPVLKRRGRRVGPDAPLFWGGASRRSERPFAAP